MSAQALRRLARGDRLVLASHNQGKAAEFSALLAPYGVAVISAASLGLAEPEETEPDFAGNAALKARAAALASGLPALADDSGFAVTALAGAPGVLSARWAGPAKDFAAAMQRVHEQAAGDPDRRAAFHCMLCLAWPDGAVSLHEGTVDGGWVWPPRGAAGFGYDPIFVPEGESRTFAEMDRAEKQRLSHRARAFARFAAACLPLPEEPGR